ncbi:MAG TPA: peptide ABC transporter substrate-binding protein [Ktedonobacteraceae bacterium]|nr:peptide ABC transporter substrate-binding protein [Ktedonobacteraceae bacterium]
MDISQPLQKVRPFVYHHVYTGVRRSPVALLFLGALLLVLAACSGGNSTTPGANGTSSSATKQVLIFPNVGTTDIGDLDPALGPDANSAVAVGMIYSGLVKSDKNLNVVPDQATWDISNNNTVYTFHIKSGITFSDGTPVTAQTYVYTLTRALLPTVKSGIASFFEGSIVGANDVNNGKTKTLAGVKALDAQTLQITLAKPTPYFLEVLTNALYFPLNEKIINQYGQVNWVNHAAGNAIGTGPFMVKEWDHNVKMILVPNPHYYGAKTRLTEVDMIFVNNPNTAYNAYRAGQYSFIWNILPQDQQTAQNTPGFMRTPLLQTDLLFFNNKVPPFNNTAVRQAFAYATDRDTLVHAVFKDAVTPAPTIIPPGMPGYQPNFPGLPFDRAKAKSLLLSVYPDVSQVPPITFSYPSSQVSLSEASALQQMWQTALGVQVKLNSVELNAYNQETANHLIQFGFTQWGADFPDPYDWLTLNLTSNAPNNNGNWSNAQFDQTVAQAEQTTGDARIALYNKAEQIAITDVGWLPIDHQAIAAIIPSWVHGVTLNGNGLYFGDWSGVYLSQH